jgi:hypothetical protein
MLNDEIKKKLKDKEIAIKRIRTSFAKKKKKKKKLRV